MDLDDPASVTPCLRVTPHSMSLDGLRLSFLIPASPTDGFRGQIAMFRRSLDHLGGMYRQADVVAVFGGSTIDELPDRWKPHFERITIHHADPRAFREGSYRAQGDARWNLVPAGSEIAILCDADTMVLRPIDDLLTQMVRSPAIGAAIAHYPFPQFPGEQPRDKWTSLAMDWVGHDIPLTYVHS